MNNKIFIVNSCKVFNLMKSFNCNIYHHLLQKFKYYDNILSKLFFFLRVKTVYYYYVTGKSEITT